MSGFDLLHFKIFSPFLFSSPSILRAAHRDLSGVELPRRRALREWAGKAQIFLDFKNVIIEIF